MNTSTPLLHPPRVIDLMGPSHPVATKLRRQHEQLVEALFQTRKMLRAYGIKPGEVHLEGESLRQTDADPPETPEVAWSAEGAHPTRTKQRARYEARKIVLASPTRPTREQILAAINRALSGSATTLNTKAIHRFILAELRTTGAALTDLRWLILHGYAAHAEELMDPDAGGRTFRRLANLGLT
ncbi:MAG: hypothetical protein V4630_18065, partial [Pseudomonadota bacterium]